MLLPNYAVRNSKKLKFIKEQQPEGLISNLIGEKYRF